MADTLFIVPFQQMFYALLYAIAAQLWGLNRALLLAGLLALLYGPYSWGPIPASISRDAISFALSVLAMAGACGMLLRQRRRGVVERSAGAEAAFGDEFSSQIIDFLRKIFGLLPNRIRNFRRVGFLL